MSRPQILSAGRRTAIIAMPMLGPASAADVRDVEVQAAAFRPLLERLGYTVSLLPMTRDLTDAERRLRRVAPTLVVNLVESLDGEGRWQHLAPGLFERLGLAFTGSRADAIAQTTDKLRTKRVLAAYGIDTPPAWTDAATLALAPDGAYIVKPVSEDASVGIDDSAVANAPRAAARLLEQRQAGGGEWFAERFLAGREFNVSLLAHADRAGAAEVLPVAEIRFDAYPPTKPRIVGYAAKWHTDSFEYAHTPRSFAVNEEDPRLAGRLGEIALACWRAFGLAGYARVDCRLDAAGAVHVLEVNANPCLAPDAGFAAACAQAGIGLDGALVRIVDAALMEPAPSAATAAAPGA